MAETMMHHDEGLPALLAQRARRASDRRLALDLALGTAAAAALTIVRPSSAWVLLVAAATCFAAFGAWGIADRAIAEAEEGALLPEGSTASPARGARIARGLAAFVGTLAGLVLAFGTVAYLIGTWIS